MWGGHSCPPPLQLVLILTLVQGSGIFIRWEELEFLNGGRASSPVSPTRVQSSAASLAAKRRKNAAHGATRGEKGQRDKPQQGERRTHFSPAMTNLFLYSSPNPMSQPQATRRTSTQILVTNRNLPSSFVFKPTNPCQPYALQKAE